MNKGDRRSDIGANIGIQQNKNGGRASFPVIFKSDASSLLETSDGLRTFTENEAGRECEYVDISSLKNGKIKVFGGQQTRPNIHIKDMVNVYRHFLEKPELPNGCYNAGFENVSIMNIAEKIAEKTNANIEIVKSNDPRSYRQDSSKLMETGFIPKYGIDDAIDEIIGAWKKG